MHNALTEINMIRFLEALITCIPVVIFFSCLFLILLFTNMVISSLKKTQKAKTRRNLLIITKNKQY